jgi:allantoinase
MTGRTGVASDRVLFHHGIKPALLVIEDGFVVDVLDRRGRCDGPIEDVGDLLVMPGLIDTNVHVSDPGRPEWEGFASATTAAAAGGTSVIFDMPLESRPPSITAAGLARKRSVTRGVIKVDVGFWGGLVRGNLQELPLLNDAGVFGFFGAFTDSGLGSPDGVSFAEFEGALQIAAGFGLPVLIDVEAPGPLRGAPPAGADHESYAASRPVEAEIVGVAAVIEAARRTGGWAHIVHLSSGDAVGLLAEARRSGVRITAETCPHFLTISAEDIPPADPRYKSSPPIRSALDRERLWAGLLDGTIDMIVSDHSPCPPEYKAAPYQDAWAGIAAMELRLPLIWTEASRRGIGLPHVVRWLSEAPGALAQLPSGSIEPGRRADLVAWDPDAEFVVDPARLFQRHPVVPYGGVPLRGIVHHTWVAGELVFAERRPVRAAKGSILEMV